MKCKIFTSLIAIVLLGHCVALMVTKAELKMQENAEADPFNNFKTSIAFYIVLGANHKVEPDLRGKFWEFQLPDFKHDYTLDYISDGPMQRDGMNITTLPPDSLPGSDKQFCKRAPAIWQHFVQNYNDTKWFYRGVHDTFLNLTALDLQLKELEKTIDPMNEWGLVYNCHEYVYNMYPHGGTGYLFSNYAVRQFVKKINEFKSICSGGADDLALSPFLQSFGIDVMAHYSTQYIVTMPNTQVDTILEGRFNEIRKCPEYYQLYSNAPKMKPCHVKTAVSMHMHHIQMDKVLPMWLKVPDNYYVTYLTPNDPRFCYK